MDQEISFEQLQEVSEFPKPRLRKLQHFAVFNNSRQEVIGKLMLVRHNTHQSVNRAPDAPEEKTTRRRLTCHFALQAPYVRKDCIFFFPQVHGQFTLQQLKLCVQLSQFRASAAMSFPGAIDDRVKLRKHLAHELMMTLNDVLNQRRLGLFHPIPRQPAREIRANSPVIPRRGWF